MGNTIKSRESIDEEGYARIQASHRVFGAIHPFLR